MFVVREVQTVVNRLTESTSPSPNYRRANRDDSTTFTFGSTSTTPDLSPALEHPGFNPKRRNRWLQPVLYIGVGVVLSTLLSAGVVHQGGGISRNRGDVATTCAKIEQFEREGGTRLGPPKTMLTAIGKGGVPGPKDLLSSNAPASSLYDALLPDLRYLAVDSWSGEVGQFLSAISQIYLAQESQRVAIIPSVWRDGDHYGSSKVRMGDLFDMERFRQETGTLFVEWSDVKAYERKWPKPRNDEIGCYFANNGFADGRSFGDYKVSTTTWNVKRPGYPGNSVEGLTIFDSDEPTRLELTRNASMETRRTIPRNLQDSQLMCYTNVWGLPRQGVWAPKTFWNGDYKAFDGLQKTKGGIIEKLHPSLRGTHPEWWNVGRYIDFSPEVWEVAILAIQKTLEVETLPSSLLSVHVRHGDFESWCPSGHGCVAPLETYKSAIDELLEDLPSDTIVLVTTDDDSSTFHSSITALGWYAVRHSSIGTADLLKSRYGDASGWWDSAVDQAILSLGKAFVGTLDSQVSLVSALRVASWNNGETKLVRRPM